LVSKPLPLCFYTSSSLLQFIIAITSIFIIYNIGGIYQCCHTEMLTKCGVKIHTLKPDYEIVNDDTTPNKKKGPFVMLVQRDLNLEFTKGLEAAFEQADGMFYVYTNLGIKNNKKYERRIEWGLTFDTW
jgi:hypothetical protein